MADHSLPTISSNYVNFLTDLDARLKDLAIGIDANSTGVPVGAIRFDKVGAKWRTWDGNDWDQDLASSYNININGTVGDTTPASGAFTTLSTTGIASLAANSTVGGATIVSTSGTQTLTNKTLTTPVISSISNSGTITLPTATTTLVGRDTTDTLSNKTLTRPRFADGGSIDDADGNKLIEFDSVASAVNYLRVNNAISTNMVELTAVGSDANVSLNLVAKGTGFVKIEGVDVATISDTQILTNKIIGSSNSIDAAAITSGTLPNARLSAVPNSALANSTISGVSLGSALNALTIGTGLTGTSYNGSAAVTITVDGTSANTASKVVVRDASGNFSASTITANLTGNVTGNVSGSAGTAGTATNLSGGSVAATTGSFSGAVTMSSTLNVTGDITGSGNITAYSDERLKTDWSYLDGNSYVSNLANIKSGTYTRVGTSIRYAGISAQNLQQVLPEAVVADAEGMLSVNYGAAAMVSAVELAKLVLQLQREIEQLKQKLA